MAHPYRVHSRDQLVTTVWGYGHVGDGRTVDVHVARLRRKLGAEYRASIVTVRRVGYKYAPADGLVRGGLRARYGTTVTGHLPAFTRRTATEPTSRCPARSEAPTTTASALRSSAAVARPL